MFPGSRNFHESVMMDEYIQSFPKETQKLLETLRKTIQKEAPEATETISSPISHRQGDVAISLGQATATRPNQKNCCLSD